MTTQSDSTLPAPGTRSARKREAILAAATGVFLKSGYLGTNMDEIAALSHVSKQTVYKHFSSKEALFIEIVTGMTDITGDAVHDYFHPLGDNDDLAAYLEAYAYRQLSIVVTPRIMQLRRLVIGEVSRFPELARVLYEHGPGRALKILADLFQQLDAQGRLAIDDPVMAAEHFNWLVMSAPLNRAMLLGDDAIPGEAHLRRYAHEGVRVFLAAYGAR
ncbi:TetR/AcrR family transcriptional regulator [Cucumibacter marinus]|uniref:TetR/AcrR family transcriptional regulator n=1 Tax=Cucumibacter marinus TaxID=1121252 RepID=UPI00040EA32F|nr:TetR/AcrR family transcriptional regulator [Cucumibacter marinus]